MSNTGETELQDLSLLEDNDLTLQDHNLDLTLGDDLDDKMSSSVRYGGSSDEFSSSAVAPLNSSTQQAPPLANGAPQEAPQPQGPKENPSIFSIAYYQSYFNVSTDDIKERIIASLIPFGGPMFDDRQSRAAAANAAPQSDEPEVVEQPHNVEPDLYGPFWIVTTVIFILAVVGNLSKYLRKYDFEVGNKLDIEKLTLAATMFYTSLFLFPTILYFVLRTYSTPRSLVMLISLYGYSFTPYIPAAALSILPGSTVSWVSVSLAFTLSTLFIVRNVHYLYQNGIYILPAAGVEQDEERQKVGMFLLLGVVAVHFTIALLTKLYFF